MLNFDTYDKYKNDRGDASKDSQIARLLNLKKSINEYISLANDYYRIIDEIKGKLNESLNFVGYMVSLIKKYNSKTDIEKGDAFFAECAIKLKMDIGDVKKRVELARVYLGEDFNIMLKNEVEKHPEFYGG